MNHIALIGNICKDIEVRYTQGNEPMAVARFSVAVQRKTKNSQGQYDSDFISCIAFGKTAENISKFFGKGSKIGVEGRIQTGSYTKQDGTKVYTTDVVVEGFDFCEKAQNTQQYAPKNAPQAPQNAPQYRQNYGTIPQAPQYAAPPTSYGPEQAQQAIQDMQMNAPSQPSEVGQGFMQIPDGVDADGLPWK